MTTYLYKSNIIITKSNFILVAGTQQPEIVGVKRERKIADRVLNKTRSLFLSQVMPTRPNWRRTGARAGNHISKKGVRAKSRPPYARPLQHLTPLPGSHTHACQKHRVKSTYDGTQTQDAALQFRHNFPTHQPQK